MTRKAPKQTQETGQEYIKSLTLDNLKGPQRSDILIDYKQPLDLTEKQFKVRVQLLLELNGMLKKGLTPEQVNEILSLKGDDQYFLENRWSSALTVKMVGDDNRTMEVALLKGSNGVNPRTTIGKCKIATDKEETNITCSPFKGPKDPTEKDKAQHKKMFENMEKFSILDSFYIKELALDHVRVIELKPQEILIQSKKQ